jgi:hypothetical protein
MSSTWFLILMVSLAAACVAIGVVRNRRYSRKEAQHRALATEYGLQIAYLNERDFSLYGHHRGYRLRIEAGSLSLPAQKKGQPVVRISLPMVNPNLKSLRILRESPAFPAFHAHGRIDRPLSLPEKVAPWLEITTNDSMFAGIILSEDVKISLFDVFNRLDTGLLLLQDEALTFITPELLLSEAVSEHYRRIITLLCDMKDELQ